jgi:hypothetical protein
MALYNERDTGAGLSSQHLQDCFAGRAVDLDARGRLQRFGVRAAALSATVFM